MNASIPFLSSSTPKPTSIPYFQPFQPLSSKASTSILSFLPSLRHAFSPSPSPPGPRPYYGRQVQHRSSSSSFKQRFDALPPNYIIFALIGINLLVFAAWQYGQQVWIEYRDPRWLRFLNGNFICSMKNFKEGRVWCLLTSCFSHESSGHILMNMISLFFMGVPVIGILGNSGFLFLYLFGGLASTCTSLLFNQVISPNIPYASHGASGAVYATLTFFAACYPTTTFLLFFVVPVPAWLCVSGIFAWDLWSSFRTRRGKTDSAGHVGGVAAGLFWFARKMGRF